MVINFSFIRLATFTDYKQSFTFTGLKRLREFEIPAGIANYVPYPVAWRSGQGDVLPEWWGQRSNYSDAGPPPCPIRGYTGRRW